MAKNMLYSVGFYCNVQDLMTHGEEECCNLEDLMAYGEEDAVICRFFYDTW